MMPGDLDVVTTIEKECSPAPWSYAIFESCLISQYSCQVAESAGKVVGFAILNLGYDESHIMNVGVSPGCRSRGVAREMLNELLDTCRRSMIETVLLEVRATNTIAIGLYHSLGFQIVGRRVGYYARGQDREDAINMSLSL
ncbi:MAG: ribosomal-protein-alanine N-acetyltransferase [Parasphingorhabdus sp.]|jgi:ribosomal-protein-alanine N-acetyltransferase